MEQLCFDFFKPAKSIPQRRLQEEIGRCALKWFLENGKPDGFAMNVPTRVSSIKADIAMFWSRTHRVARSSFLEPSRTVAVVSAVSLEQCWVNCGNHDQMLNQLISLRHKMDDLEAVIRSTEPNLRDNAALFEEFAIWNYEKSANRDYQQVRTAYNQLEKSLYAGSRFDRIAAAGIADELYLVVPAGMIRSDQLFRNWGILEVTPDRSITLARKPARLASSPEARTHLVQNIASSAAEAVRFCAGLNRQADGTYIYIKRPKRRRGEDTTNLDLP